MVSKKLKSGSKVAKILNPFESLAVRQGTKMKTAHSLRSTLIGNMQLIASSWIAAVVFGKTQQAPGKLTEV